MERPRATWTDERLDDLSRRVDDGFKRLDEDMRSQGSRIDALQRTMLVVAGGIIANFAGIVSLIAIQA